MKIAIGSDHGGYDLKEKIKKFILSKGYELEDVGSYSRQSVDYPDYSEKVCNFVLEKNSLGILICGTGIGMSIAANKHPGIRAALVGDVFSAKATREHNDSNVLCLGERVTGEGLAMLIVETWLNSEYQGGRHQNRIDKLENTQV